MQSTFEKKIINLNTIKYSNWKSCLNDKFKENKSNQIEVDCGSLFLTCKDISQIIDASNNWNCKILIFWSTIPSTIVSIKGLGYSAKSFKDEASNSSSEDKSKNQSYKTFFYQGTVRSGEYVESQGDLLIYGDVNPGAMVSAEGNVIIWGRLLGTAHAGKEGNSKATISALQLRPVQLRIANKVARGPKEKPQIGLAEQAVIKSENIIISPIETL